MNTDSRLRISFATIVALFFSGLPAFAGDVTMPTASRPAPVQQVAKDPGQSMPPDNEEVTILRDAHAGEYNQATLENLSKLYWRLGAFDFEDKVAVANYIKINDCKIYSEYLNDDMEWTKIVSVMQDHLKKSADTFPTDFQFVLKLHLGRYEPERGGFPIVDRTGFIDAQRISVDSLDHDKAVCFDSNVINDYPKSAVILLPEAFTFDFLKLDEHVAQAYILRKKSEYSKLSAEQKVIEYERTAYLRLRVTFSQYHGNMRGEGASNTMAILYGTLDGYEVFEDASQKRLMRSVDLRQPDHPQMSMPGAAQ